MQITATAGDLAKVFKTLQLVVLRKTTIPVLGFASVVAERHETIVSATDLDMELSLKLPAISSRPGRMMLPVAGMQSLLAHLPADRAVTIDSTNGGGTSVGFKGATYRVPFTPSSDYPLMADFEPIVTATPEDPAALTADFKAVTPFISSEETRYYLNGVCLDAADDPKLVATDGHRLAAKKAAVTLQGNMPENSVIFPRKAVAIIAALGLAGPIRIGEKRAEADLVGGTLRTRLIDGEFPNWRRVVPEARDFGFKIDAAAVIPAIRRLRAFFKAVSDQRYGVVTLAANPFGGVMVAHDEGERSACEETFGGDTMRSIGADPMCAAFRPSYLIDLLKTAKGERVSLVGAEASGDPRVIADEDFIRVIMPMRKPELAAHAVKQLSRAQQQEAA